VEVPALSLAHVRDTTGAGDAFAAGLLLALADGDDVVTAVGRGHAVAADTLLRSR
jgi:sugar/nucleoside kinase (ribokinase family)